MLIEKLYDLVSDGIRFLLRQGVAGTLDLSDDVRQVRRLLHQSPMCSFALLERSYPVALADKNQAGHSDFTCGSSQRPAAESMHCLGISLNIDRGHCSPDLANRRRIAIRLQNKIFRPFLCKSYDTQLLQIIEPLLRLGRKHAPLRHAIAFSRREQDQRLDLPGVCFRIGGREQSAQ